MASSAAITPLGLLHMRPLQRWLHDRVPRWAWRHGTYRVSLTPSCHRTFSPCSDLAFLRAGVPLEKVSRHVVVSTDASTTGWGAMCNGHAAAGLWTGPQLQWHINCLELLAVWLALRRFRTLLHDKHILVRSDNTATVAYINHQGGLRSRRMFAYANMRFPQWAFSHRPCARSGRTRSKSSWWRLTGLIGRGYQNWCSSRQPLLGKFLWGGISFLREGALSGTRAQTCGISTYGPWTGRGGSKWATSSGSKHYHFC